MRFLLTDTTLTKWLLHSMTQVFSKLLKELRSSLTLSWKSRSPGKGLNRLSSLTKSKFNRRQRTLGGPSSSHVSLSRCWLIRSLVSSLISPWQFICSFFRWTTQITFRLSLLVCSLWLRLICFRRLNCMTTCLNLTRLSLVKGLLSSSVRWGTDAFSWFVIWAACIYSCWSHQLTSLSYGFCKEFHMCSVWRSERNI